MVSALNPLLQTVIENPDDLDARLVYADSLQEAGDPRGEFITLHIQGNPAADRLLRLHKKEWTSFLQPAVKRGYRFINGFVERVTLKAEYLQQLPEFFEHTPLREVRFRDLGASATKLAEMSACTSRLTWLDLKQAHLTGQGFAALMKANWDRLWRIWAPSNGIGNIGLQALITARLPRLTSLNLHGTRLSDESLAALRDWPGLPQIEELNLRGNTFSDEAMSRFCTTLANVRRFGLTHIGPLTAESLLKREHDLELLLASDVEESASMQLNRRFAGALRIQEEYQSPFDIEWP